MTANSIPSASWKAFETRKMQTAGNADYICPEELWEFNYLLDTILRQDPDLDQITVMLAIRQAMRETVAPRPRDYFVDIVLQSINERKKEWSKLVDSTRQDAA